jgi:hypothetical protein
MALFDSVVAYDDFFFELHSPLWPLAAVHTIAACTHRAFVESDDSAWDCSALASVDELP